jgi:hypothetical protein
MSSPAEAHWTDGIATPVYQMFDKGASNEDVDRFLRARQDGDLELAQRLLSEAGWLAQPGAPSRTESSARMALQDIMVAALRPVVNELTAQELLNYIAFVSRASELLVEHADEAVWESHAVVQAAGSSLRQAALKWLSGR